MFDFLNNNRKLPRELRNMIAPREAFEKKTKTAFLAVFDTAHPESRPSHVTGLVKTLIASGALVSVLASASVYADTANVAADNPLYPLKRLGENVQLTLAPAKEKPQLQATFIARRAVEINDLSERQPSSTLIGGLAGDLDSALDTSLTDAKSVNLADGQLTSFCDQVLSAIATSSADTVGVHSRGRSAEKHGKVLSRFVNQCDPDDVATVATSATIGNGGDDEAAEAVASSVATPVFSAKSRILVAPVAPAPSVMIAPGRKALFQKIRDEAARDLMDGRGDRGGDVPTSTSSESDGRKLNFRDSSGGVTSSTANISNQWKRHSEDESR